MSAQRGFTLLELMIVVAVIGVLAMIGLPSYSDYIKRSKIAEATATLGEVRTKMEQFFLDNRTYVGSDAAANLPCHKATMEAGKKYFTFDCDTLAVGTYRVTATGVAGEGMKDFEYTINQSNQRTTTITNNPGWDAAKNCWVTRKGGIC